MQAWMLAPAGLDFVMQKAGVPVARALNSFLKLLKCVRSTTMRPFDDAVFC